MVQKYFTPRDRGHVEEIKFNLEHLEKDKVLDLSAEKEWLDGLNERFGPPLTKQQPAEIVIAAEMDRLKSEVNDFESIKNEVARIGSEAYEKYKRNLSEKEYWTYMTCRRITSFIDSLNDKRTINEAVLAKEIAKIQLEYDRKHGFSDEDS